MQYWKFIENLSTQYLKNIFVVSFVYMFCTYHMKTKRMYDSNITTYENLFLILYEYSS